MAAPAPPGEVVAYPPDAERPLAAFAGERPPAPPWFEAAIAAEPEPTFASREGRAIEMRVWGPSGAPGVLLMHGNLANARWWSWIAPFLANDRRVVAMSFAGMGLSDPVADGDYDLDGFLADALAVAEQARLFKASVAPVFIGHSAGGGPTVAAAAIAGVALSGAVLVDVSFKPPELAPPRAPSNRVNRVYPDLATALSRYRFAPPQPCTNLFIADFIARSSLAATARGHEWRFDPRVWRQFRPSDAWSYLAQARCPLAFVNGDRSALTVPEVVDRLRRHAPPRSVFVDVPDAHHHVMVDQPLALVAALRTLLELWVPISAVAERG